MTWKFELVHGPLQRPIGGLAWDGEAMLIADINDSVILRYAPREKRVSVARSPRIASTASPSDRMACSTGAGRFPAHRASAG